MTHELLPEISNRKSTTHWNHTPISADTWNVLFEAARRAPSSWNHQPARYVLVSDTAAMRKLAHTLHRCNSWATHAAGLVVQVACPDDDDRVDGKDYYLYDCGLAIMSLVYQAQKMGITTRQMIGFDEGEVRARLNIPDRYRVVVIAGLGYPATGVLLSLTADAKRAITAQNKRFQMKHLVFRETWGDVLA